MNFNKDLTTEMSVSAASLDTQHGDDDGGAGRCPAYEPGMQPFECCDGRSCKEVPRYLGINTKVREVWDPEREINVPMVFARAQPPSRTILLDTPPPQGGQKWINLKTHSTSRLRTSVVRGPKQAAKSRLRTSAVRGSNVGKLLYAASLAEMIERSAKNTVLAHGKKAVELAAEFLKAVISIVDGAGDSKPAAKSRLPTSTVGGSKFSNFVNYALLQMKIDRINKAAKAVGSTVGGANLPVILAVQFEEAVNTIVYGAGDSKPASKSSTQPPLQRGRKHKRRRTNNPNETPPRRLKLDSPRPPQNQQKPQRRNINHGEKASLPVLEFGSSATDPANDTSTPGELQAGLAGAGSELVQLASAPVDQDGFRHLLPDSDVTVVANDSDTLPLGSNENPIVLNSD